jgi:uncharacterized lipoprotein NlpE involved in copper resistance
MMKIIKVFSLSALVGLALVACNNSSDFHQQLAKEHAALETEHKNLEKAHQKTATRASKNGRRPCQACK